MNEEVVIIQEDTEDIEVRIVDPLPSYGVKVVAENVVERIYYGSGGGDDVIGETPAGLVNGVNASFTSAFNFIAESVEVFLNGLKLKKPDEFNTSGVNNITLALSPGTGEILLINYKKQL